MNIGSLQTAAWTTLASGEMPKLEVGEGNEPESLRAIATEVLGTASGWWHAGRRSNGKAAAVDLKVRQIVMSLAGGLEDMINAMISGPDRVRHGGRASSALEV